jgi:hypothetical protein
MILPFVISLVAVHLVTLSAATLAVAEINESEFSSNDIINRDVTIIGGGSSGTYAAIRLRKLGYSVAVVEQKDTLGGHVNTFFDPVTGSSFDYGVITFQNIPVVNNYFEHFNVTLGPPTYNPGPTQYFNFLNASAVNPSDITGNVTEALIGYLAQLDKYPYLFPNGYQIPDPIPEDLLLPYGDFLEKYNLQGLAYTAFSYIQGVGNILKQPTLYIMKYFTPITANAILGGNPGFLTTTHHDNHALYVAAAIELGPDALLSSNVTIIQRENNVVYTLVSTPSRPKLLKSSWLLIAIQPKLSNLAPFLDLDSTETSLLGQFNNSYYWDGVVRNSGIPDNTSLSNVDLSAALNLPAMPALYGVEASGTPGLHTIYFSSPYYIPDSEVESRILKTIAALVKAAGYPPPANGTAELVAFNSHAPFECTVSVDSIQRGFYGKLNGLQGQRRTWWTGATWQAHDSSLIWNWTEYNLLPKMQAVL